MGFSSITGNAYGSVMQADNVSFDGTYRGGIITTDGQLLIGSSVAPHIRVGTLTAGTGISIVTGNGTISISSSTSVTWSLISASQTLVIDNGYFCVSPGGALALLLPPVSKVGDTIEITLDGATSFAITQAAGQQIRFGNQTTTSGVTGSVTSNNQGDSIRMVCRIANLSWNIVSSIGTLTIA